MAVEGGKLWAGPVALNAALKRISLRLSPLGSAILATLFSLFHMVQPAKPISQPRAEEPNVFLCCWALDLTISPGCP